MLIPPGVIPIFSSAFTLRLSLQLPGRVSGKLDPEHSVALYVGLIPSEEESEMKCQFCHQDVSDPCHNVQEMQHRAMSHVERCEHALKDQKDMRSSAHARDVQSSG